MGTPTPRTTSEAYAGVPLRPSGSLDNQLEVEPAATQDISQNQGAKLLVVCNAYPSKAALYRNGFIHRRVKAYIDAGYKVQIFYHHEPASTPYSYRYDGVPVRVGNEAELGLLLENKSFDAYLVHFAEPQRVRPILHLNDGKPILVWIHGFEAEAWHRRWFNFIGSPAQTRAALKKRQEYYDGQNAFLRDLVENKAGHDIAFINVSRWFQRFIVEPDIGVEFEDSSTVIPNLVDETVFPYRRKQSTQRLSVLSIRPFASRKYANDLTVGAIMSLSKRPYFNEMTFTICGEGPLFAETTAPLQQFKNVNLVNRFLSQDEIRDLHAAHGVFLAPTRFDSQGVSMCEAMSSGLVTVSTRIAAIPEYVQHGSTGLLSAPESASELADHIERLYFNEELFLNLSEAGSQWMHSNCGLSATIGREIKLVSEKVR